MCIQDLPRELLLEVALHTSSGLDLIALAQTSREFYTILTCSVAQIMGTRALARLHTKCPLVLGELWAAVLASAQPYCLGGSTVAQLLLGVEWGSSDVDLYVGQELADFIQGSLVPERTLSHPDDPAYPVEYVHAMETYFPGRDIWAPKFDVITLLSETTPAQLLGSYDLDICANALYWHPTRGFSLVMGNQTGLRSMTMRHKPISSTMARRERDPERMCARKHKYVERGFTLASGPWASIRDSWLAPAWIRSLGA